MRLFASILISAFALFIWSAEESHASTNVTETSFESVLESGLPQQNQIIFGYELTPISDWNSARRQALNLFPNYKAIETFDPLTGSEDLEVYQSHAVFIINLPVSQINLKNLDAAKFIQSFDPDLSHTPIDANEANSLYQDSISKRMDLQKRILENRSKKGQLNSAEYSRALENLESQAEFNRAQEWCRAAESECISSMAPFPMDWQFLLDSGKLAGQIDQDFPKEIHFMSEVLKGSGNELAGRPEVKFLSERVPYPISSVLIESSFWFNRFIQSGKTVISLHSVSDSKTLVVVSAVLAVEQDALTKYDMLNFKIRDVFLGQSFFINRDQGFAKGLPPYNKDLAVRLKEQLENR